MNFPIPGSGNCGGKGSIQNVDYDPPSGRLTITQNGCGTNNVFEVVITATGSADGIGTGATWSVDGTTGDITLTDLLGNTAVLTGVDLCAAITAAGCAGSGGGDGCCNTTATLNAGTSVLTINQSNGDPVTVNLSALTCCNTGANLVGTTLSISQSNGGDVNVDLAALQQASCDLQCFIGASADGSTTNGVTYDPATWTVPNLNAPADCQYAWVVDQDVQAGVPRQILGMHNLCTSEVLQVAQCKNYKITAGKIGVVDQDTGPAPSDCEVISCRCDTTIVCATAEVTVPSGDDIVFELYRVAAGTAPSTPSLLGTFTLPAGQKREPLDLSTFSSLTVPAGASIGDFVVTATGDAENLVISIEAETCSSDAFGAGVPALPADCCATSFQVGTGGVTTDPSTWGPAANPGAIVFIYDTDGRPVGFIDESGANHVFTMPFAASDDADTGSVTTDHNRLVLSSQTSQATGTRSTVLSGINALASGNNSIAGHGGQATGFGSIAIGQGSVASNSNSTALGRDDTSAGIESMTWGRNTQSLLVRDTAWGIDTIANAGNATAFGTETSATGLNSTATGSNSVADQAEQVAIGRYNLSGQAGAILSVGNGVSGTPSDAFRVHNNSIFAAAVRPSGHATAAAIQADGTIPQHEVVSLDDGTLVKKL